MNQAGGATPNPMRASWVALGLGFRVAGYAYAEPLQLGNLQRRVSLNALVRMYNTTTTTIPTF